MELRTLSRSCGVPVEILWSSCGFFESCGVPFDIDIGLDIDHDQRKISVRNFRVTDIQELFIHHSTIHHSSKHHSS